MKLLMEIKIKKSSYGDANEPLYGDKDKKSLYGDTNKPPYGGNGNKSSNEEESGVIQWNRSI